MSRPGSAAAAVTFSSGSTPFPPCTAAAPQRRRRSPAFAALTNGKNDISGIGANRGVNTAVVVRHQGQRRRRCMVLVLTRSVGRPQHQTTPHQGVVVLGMPLVVDQPLVMTHLLLMLMMPLAATRR